MRRTPEFPAPLPDEGLAVLTGIDYTRDFAAEVMDPDTSFAYLSAMHVMPQDEYVHDMYYALMNLVQRKGPGSAVIYVDAFNRMMPDDKTNTLFSPDAREAVREARALFDEFSEAGGIVIETNPPSLPNLLLPQAGRNHTKGAGVFKSTATGPGHAVTYKGGVNAYYPGIKMCNDFMVKMPGLDLGQTMLGITNALAHHRYGGARIRQLTPDLAMAIDDPRFPGDSPTLWSLYGMAGYQGATGLDFTTQYAPDPIMTSFLKRQAISGAQVRVIVPSEEFADQTLDGQINYQRLLRIADRNPNLRIIRSDKYIHSKYMGVYTGGKTPEFVSFGSSNGYYKGGLAMTQEEQFFSTNRRLNELVAGVVEGFIVNGHEATGLSDT